MIVNLFKGEGDVNIRDSYKWWIRMGEGGPPSPSVNKSYVIPNFGYKPLLSNPSFTPVISYIHVR